MLLGSYPRLLALALSLPELAHALGLGNVRVDSRLGEPLAAQIDIIGATPEELKALNASVANPEIFERYRVDRPAFLSSATIMVSQDAQGRPVLNIQSTEAFTEPLVSLLVDLRWGTEELVREYSLLLDPVQLTPASPGDLAAIAYNGPSPLVQLPAPEASNIVLASAAVDLATTVRAVPEANAGALIMNAHHRVVAHDTLRGIARRAGARSEADQLRMMMAIFQANRDAFAGNINRLHRGAVLVIPSAEEIKVINSAEADREIRAQMTAWRPAGRPAARRAVAAQAAATPGSIGARTPDPEDSELSTVRSAMNRLDGHVQFLQQALDETNRHLAGAMARIGNVEQLAGNRAAAPVRPMAPEAQPAITKAPLSAMAWALTFLVGGVIFACRRFLPGWARLKKSSAAQPLGGDSLVAHYEAIRAAAPTMPEVDALLATPSAGQTEAVVPGVPVDRENSEDGDTVEITQSVAIDADTIEEYRAGAQDEPDTVVMETVQHTAAAGTNTELDYNLADLDARAQHVEMPGTLRDQVVVVERRKNVVDSLLAAIQRDPTRGDLRMKLLESLYTAASSNLRVFKQVVGDLARHPDRLSADEWKQVMAMGREIAADDALFTDQAEDDIAHCA